MMTSLNGNSFCYWPFVQGIHRSLVSSLHKGPVTQSFDGSFDLRLNKRLSKQSRCQFLRRQHAYYDVIVMIAVSEKTIWKIFYKCQYPE